MRDSITRDHLGVGISIQTKISWWDLGTLAGNSLLFVGQLSAAENTQELSKEQTPS